MGIVHDKEDFGPFDQVCVNGGDGIGVGAGGERFEARAGGEDGFCGWAAQAVLAAEEEDFHWYRTCGDVAFTVAGFPQGLKPC